MIAETMAAAVKLNCGGRNHVRIYLERPIVDRCRKIFAFRRTRRLDPRARIGDRRQLPPAQAYRKFHEIFGAPGPYSKVSKARGPQEETISIRTDRLRGEVPSREIVLEQTFDGIVAGPKLSSAPHLDWDSDL